ncbi:conserved exported hypothetical protein [Verrucomicrobia bacterium]|nr:conserved exported hypothetical protein [Verrucomicrobiota bacterium]
MAFGVGVAPALLCFSWGGLAWQAYTIATSRQLDQKPNEVPPQAR